MLGLRKPNFKTKIIPFEKSHNAENCKRGPLRLFKTHSVAKFQKTEGRPFGIFRKIFEKRTKNEKFSLIVPKNQKKRDFLAFGLLQNIKQIEGRTLCGH